MESSRRPALSLETLERLPRECAPRVDPRELDCGIVHLGVGAFHRAHQAVFTEAAMAETGRRDWGIRAVTQRTAHQSDLLRAQDGLYSVLVRGHASDQVSVVAAIRSVIDGSASSREVTEAIADARTRIVSLTVTERGYRMDPATDRLLDRDPAVVADALGGQPPQTVVGRLAAGLEARRAGGAGPISVLSCDNLPANGTVLHRALAEFLALAGRRYEALAAWLEGNVTFPHTMVDRVVPVTTDADLADIAEATGLEDRAGVVTEPFSQWVIEDRFAAERPLWEAAGAELVDDVAPYEAMKLRLLNGSHSAIAYLGLLLGERTVPGAVSRPELRDVVELLMAEVSNVLVAPARVDLGRYRADLMGRFVNPALPDELERIASDGSQKLPRRLLDAVLPLRVAGIRSRIIPLVAAAWAVALVRQRDDAGSRILVRDPLTPPVQHETQRDAILSAVRTLLRRPGILNAGLAADPLFVDEVAVAAETILDRGAAEAIRRVRTGGGA